MKKKCLLILASIILLSNLAQAQSCDYTCKSPVDLSSKAMQIFSIITGQNFVSEKVFEQIIKKSIAKKIDGDFDVNLDGYSFTDLKNGKFKSLKIMGESVNIKRIYFSAVKLQTICDYNYIDFNNSEFEVKEDLPANFSLMMSEQDLNKTMLSTDYQKLLKELNLFGSSLNLFEITSSTVKISENKIDYILEIKMPFIGGKQRVIISADLKVENGEIKFVNAEFNTNFLKINLNNITEMLNYINPLAFSINMLENNKVNINTSDIILNEGKIYVNGKVIVLKN
ncbi:MAG: hypothetical protein R3Y28_03270 [Candidatus Gastranaerophilales bacterium]